MSFAAGTNLKWVVVDDFNGDGKRDLAVANNADLGTGVSILLGNGDGTFGAAASVQTGGPANHIDSGDFNGDGKRDLAVVHDIHASRFRQHRSRNRQWDVRSAEVATTRASGPGAVGVGDFNGNGRSDFAIPTFFGSARGDLPQHRERIARQGAGIRGRFAAGRASPSPT